MFLLSLIVTAQLIAPAAPSQPNTPSISIEEPIVEEVIVVETPTYETPSYVLDVDLSVELQTYTYELCEDYGITDYYKWIISMMYVESKFQSDTISASDDYGLMQINKCNHAWLSTLLGITDFLDPYQNIEAGIYIFAYLIGKYDIHKSLMAYNYGEAAAKRRWKEGIYNSSYSLSVEEYYKTLS